MAFKHIDDNIEPYLDILIDCVKLRGSDIEEQIKRITSDTDLMGECLEENFLNFKLHSKKVRDEYEKAVTEEISKTEKVWEKCDELIANSKPRITKVTNQLLDLKKSISEIDKALDVISVYKAEKVIELIDKVNSMSEKDKEILLKILKNDSL